MQPGLADPVLDSQRIFRSVLDAISGPGRVITLAPAGPTVPPCIRRRWRSAWRS
jgi:alpha-D-ribose 1-methylphosphonate 5-triphosphate synthase subunit PhnH